MSGIKLGGRIEDVKERYPSLTCLDQFGRLWGPGRASDVAIDLLFVEAESSVITAVSGYSLEIEHSRFQRYDRVEELLKIAGVAQVVERRKPNHSVYQELYFPRLSLKVYVEKDAQEIIGEFTLGRPKRDIPEP
ncbi:MAG: hypothetical protein HC888_04360 [Candidatus Competibacteraceae bacterium]|nr:hypothetical protein [Candidatus Competibacteraceae bacterium]